MNHNKEWYWNLNIHRDQTALANISAGSGVHLPKSSSCYTNAVITDVGLCVGMRNVNLTTENEPYFGKAAKMPNCCSNLNVVGQHNEQIWAMAYDRMKYSMLTDPSMAIHPSSINNPLFASYSYQQSHHPYPYHGNWNPHLCYNRTNIAISARTSPFHLFGDRSNLSSTQNANIPPSMSYGSHNKSLAGPTDCADVPMKCIQSMEMNGEHSITRHNNALFNPMLYDINNNYNNDNNSNNGCRISVCGPLFSYSMDSFESFVNGEPSSEKNNDDNVFGSYHVTPPKKKWMQNYMQSNSTTYIHILLHKYFFVDVCL